MYLKTAASLETAVAFWSQANLLEFSRFHLFLSIFNLPVIKGVPLVFANWEDIKHLYVIGKTPSQKSEESNQNIA